MSRPQLARGEYGRPRLTKIDETLGTLLKSKTDKPSATVVTPMEQKVAKALTLWRRRRPSRTKPTSRRRPPLKTTGRTAEENLGARPLPGPLHRRRREVKAGNDLPVPLTNPGREPQLQQAKDQLAYPSLAEDKELTSPWWPKEDSKEVIQVQLAPEFHYFGTELDDKAETEKKKRIPSSIPTPRT